MPGTLKNRVPFLLVRQWTTHQVDRYLGVAPTHIYQHADAVLLQPADLSPTGNRQTLQFAIGDVENFLERRRRPRSQAQIVLLDTNGRTSS